MDDAARASGASPSTLGGWLNWLSIVFAYAGGAMVAAVGIMSAISIVGRSALGRPIIGDFELVEFGTAIAGALFLPYCQTSYGHIVVDVFTLKMPARGRNWLDRFGSLLMAVMFFAVGWRTITGMFEMYSNHETTMLMGVPVWIGYAGMVPGVFLAGLLALAQSAGLVIGGHTADEPR
jgi:TRAP-type C4-dicarboxylate transport system permease small subunit